MRILIISSWFPYPPDNGSRMRVFNMTKGLSKSHKITLLALAESVGEAMSHLPVLRTYCREVKVTQRKPFWPRGRKAILGFLAGRPRSLVDTYSPEMQALVESAARSNDHDLILACQLGVAQYALGQYSIAKVLEEIGITILKDQFLRAKDWASKLRYGLTWWRFARYVEVLLGEFDACTVASERERDCLTKMGPHCQAVEVIPNGVDVPLYDGDFGAPVPDTLIYPGAVTYSANYDAVHYFLNDIYPLIKDEKPGAALRVTGKTAGVSIDELAAYDDVAFTGYVPDIKPWVARSRACVVPLRVGGGTRLKILESMALGTPVVSTSKGAEGLEVTLGVDILIADTPATFARHVNDLLQDCQLRERLSANGQKLAREKYDWEIIGQRLETCLGDIVARRHQ